MERALMRLVQSSRQRGAVAAFSSQQQVRRYLSPTSSASDGFSHSVLSEPKSVHSRLGWSRGCANWSSVQKEEAPQGNVEVLEFGTHRTATAKRFAVGTTAVDVDEVHDPQTEEEIQERAKEVLQQVSEKIDETVEESQVRKLQEKLVRTEGIGEVVQELYNKPDPQLELELDLQVGDRA